MIGDQGFLAEREDGLPPETPQDPVSPGRAAHRTSLAALPKPQDPPAVAEPSAGRASHRAALQRTREQSERLLAANFNEAVKADPDLAGEAQRLAPGLGIDPLMAERNIDKVRQAWALRNAKLSELAGGDSVLGRMLMDPHFARVAHDDLDNLGWWDRIKKAGVRGELQTEMGFLGTSQRRDQLDEAGFRRLAYVREQLRALPETEGFLASAAELLGQQIGTLPKAATAGAVLGGAAAIAGQLGPQALAPEEIITVPTAATIGFVSQLFRSGAEIQSGLDYLSMLDEGYDPTVAARASMASGLVGGVLEVAGAGALAKGAGIIAKPIRDALTREVAQGVAKALAQPTVKGAAATFAKGYLTGVAGETVTEVLQEGVSITADEIARALGSDKASRLTTEEGRKEIVDRLVGVAVKTAQGMAVLGAPGPTFAFVRDQRRAAEAEQNGRFFEDLATKATESKVAERNPDAFQRLVTEAAAGEPIETIYVEGSKFAEVLQQAGVTPAQLDAIAPGLGARVTEAAVSGGDVVIPTGEYAAKLARRPEIDGALRPHLRLGDPDAMSLAEAEVFQQAKKARVEETAAQVEERMRTDEAFAASARTVEMGMREQLVATGRMTAAEAGHAAKLWREFAAVQANRLGITPEEFASRYPVRVVAATAQDAGPLQQPSAPETPEFRAWFGESKVRDAEGKPLVLYHQTDRTSEAGIREEGFDLNRKRARATDQGVPDGVFLKPDTKDIRVGGDVQMPLFAAINRPLVVASREDLELWATRRDEQYKDLERRVRQVDNDGAREIEKVSSRESRRQENAPGETDEEVTRRVAETDAVVARVGAQLKEAAAAARKRLTELLREAGHDGVIIEKDAGSFGRSTKTYIALDPRQVKSPGNRGTFDPKDPNILRAPEARGGFDPKRLLIGLAKGESPAETFLHEAAHAFLHIYADIAAQPNAPAPIAQDFQAFLDWRGIKDVAAWHAMDLEAQRRHHEAFAYSFENYLFENVAPSPELRTVFQRFKAWVARVYVAVRAELNATYRREFGEDLPALTPEVRQIMDRMLASEAAAARAETIRGLIPAFEMQEQSGKSDAEWAAYLADQEALRAALGERLTSDTLGTLAWLRGARGRKLRELQKGRREDRARLVEQIEAELAAEPVYRARKWLREGRMPAPDGTVQQVDKDPNHRLRTADVQAILGDEAKKLSPLTAKHGLSPDDVAKVFEFETGEQLVRALAAAPPIDKAAEAAADARGAAAPIDDEAVDRAVMTEGRTRFAADEWRALTRAVQPVREMMAAARAAAEGILARKTLRELRPAQYAAAERRAASEALSAVRKGDMATAADAKRRQLVQGWLARLSRDARQEVVTAEKRHRRFGERDEKLATSRDVDLIYLGRALLAAYRMGPPVDSGRLGSLAAARETVAKDLPALGNRVDALTAAAQGIQDFRTLTLEHFREVAQTVEGLWTQSRQNRLLDAEGKKLEMAAAVNELEGAILDKAKAPPEDASEPTKTPSVLRRRVLKVWSAVASLKRMDHVARFMDGGKAGPFAKHFVEPVRRALAEYRGEGRKVTKALHDRIVALAEASGPAWDAAIAAPELGHTFRGLKELLGAFLHVGSLSNLQKLLVGRRWAVDPRLTGAPLDTSKWDQFLARMYAEGKLTKAHVDFARFVWRTYAEQLPKAQATHKKLYGYEFETIELREVVTPFGTFEGGYVPARIDRDEADPRIGDIVDSIEGTETAFLYSIGTGKGFTLARNPLYNQPLALDLARQVGHIDEELRFIYLQPVIKDALRIIRNQDFASVLNRYDRNAINHILLPWLDNTARQASSRPSGNQLIDGAAIALRSAASLATLGFNLINAAIQITGLSNARTQVAGRYMRSALWQYMTGRPTAVAEARERSAFMDQHLEQETRILRERIARLGRVGALEGFDPRLALLGRGAKATQQAFARWAFLPQRITQGIVDVVTWHGAYQQAVANGLEHAAAVAEADGAVVRSQGARNPENLAAYEVTSPFVQLFTQFGSYSNVVLNTVLAAKGHRTSAIAWTILLPALIEGTIRTAMLWRLDDEDDDGPVDELAALYGKSLLRNVAGLVPGIGPMLLGLAENDGRDVMRSPAGSVIGAGWRGVGAFLDAAPGGDEFTGQDARDLGLLLTAVTGLPLGAAGRALGYRQDEASGKKPAARGTADYVRGLIVGR